MIIAKNLGSRRDLPHGNPEDLHGHPEICKSHLHIFSSPKCASGAQEVVTEPFLESFSGDRILAMLIAKILALPRDPRESKRDPREAKKQPPEARKWYHNRFFKSLPGVQILAMIIPKNLAV